MSERVRERVLPRVMHQSSLLLWFKDLLHSMSLVSEYWMAVIWQVHRLLYIPTIILTTVKRNCCQKCCPRETARHTEFHCVIYVTGDEQRSIHFDLIINCYQIMSLLINREEYENMKTRHLKRCWTLCCSHFEEIPSNKDFFYMYLYSICEVQN